jgi:dipeptidase
MELKKDTDTIANNEDLTNYDKLEKLRKIIEKLEIEHHLEIAKIFKNNNIKLTQNNNGIFINLNNIPSNIIEQIYNYLEFIKKQENLISIDESKKETLENKYFKDKLDLVTE